MEKYWDRYKKIFLTVIVLLLAVFFRFYRLDEIPSEIFGDVVNNLENLQSARDDKFELYRGEGTHGKETMLFYLMIPLTKILGINYLSLKIGVAIAGLVTVVTVFWLAKIAGGWRLGLVTAFLMAVSKWPVVYSRIGFRNVLTPLFLCLTYYFLIKIYKNKTKFINFASTGLFLGLGLYTYTAFRFAVVTVFVSMFYILFRVIKKDRIKKLKYFGVFSVVFLVTALPMVVDHIKRPGIYMAHAKPMLLDKEDKLRLDWKNVLTKNTINNNLMFFKRGDVVFRVNPTLSPQLDPISAFFLVVGVVVFLFQNKGLFFILFFAFEMLQLPSILVLNFPTDIPSATRSIGIIPFVYLFVARGLLTGKSVVKKILEKFFKKRIACLMGMVGLSFLLIKITMFNYNYYFNDYRLGLPNHNVGYAKEISRFIEGLPEKSKVVVIGSGWGEWGQPENKAVGWFLEKKGEIVFVDKENFTCDLTEKKTGDVVIYDPVNVDVYEQVEECYEDMKPIYKESIYGEKVFAYIEL